MTVTNDTSNLYLTNAVNGKTITLANWIGNVDFRVGQVQFDNGLVWDATTLLSLSQSTGKIGATFVAGTRGDDEVAGNAGGDVLIGGAGNDILYGDGGNDILLGGDGNDDIEDWQGNNYFDAGTGDDYVYADGAPNFTDGGSNFVTGGTGNDWIDSYAANNVIAFNVGDGNDTIYAAGSLTISLGANLDIGTLTRSEMPSNGATGFDFLLTTGPGDSILLTRYAEADSQAWPQITLQTIGAGAINRYDLTAIINDFQLQAVQNPSLSLSLNAVLPSHVIGTSTTDAIGGELAYQYAIAGNTGSLSVAQKQAVLTDANFGAAPQSIGISGIDQAPILASPVADQTASQDSAFNYTVPAATFSGRRRYADRIGGACRRFGIAGMAEFQPFDKYFQRHAGERGCRHLQRQADRDRHRRAGSFGHFCIDGG